MLCGQQVPFSETWPTSGMTRSGRLYPRPTRAPRTDANESSSSPGLLPMPMTVNRTSQRAQTGRPTSGPQRGGPSYGLEDVLLPTPSAGNFNDGESLDSREARRQVNLAKGVNGNGQGTPLAIAAQKLLRTPTAQLAVNGGSQHPDKRKAGGHGPTLADEVKHLLPTPQARDSAGAKTPDQVAAMRARGYGVSNLNETAVNELALLPTPSVALATGGQTSRSGDRIGEPLLPAIAKSISSGDLTPLPSPAGSTSPDAQLHGQLSLGGPESA